MASSGAAALAQAVQHAGRNATRYLDLYSNSSWSGTVHKFLSTREIVAHGCKGHYVTNATYTWFDFKDATFSDFQITWIGNFWSAFMGLSLVCVLLSLSFFRCPYSCRLPPGESRTRVELGFSAVFAFCTGWVDIISYRRHRCFATMMVGNLLLLGESLTEHLVCGQDAEYIGPKPLFYLSLIFFFMFGAVIYRISAKRCGWSGRNFAPMVVTSFLFYDLFLLSLKGQALERRWNVVRMAPIFGIVNAVSSRILGTLPWGTTGHVITTASAIGAVIMGNCGAEEKAKAIKAVTMILSFLCGGVSGTALSVYGIRRHGSEMVFDYTVPGCCIALLLYAGEEFAAADLKSKEELPQWDELPRCDWCRTAAAEEKAVEVAVLDSKVPSGRGGYDQLLHLDACEAETEAGDMDGASDPEGPWL